MQIPAEKGAAFQRVRLASLLSEPGRYSLSVATRADFFVSVLKISISVWMTPFNHHWVTDSKTCKIVEATATPDGGFDTCAL